MSATTAPRKAGRKARGRHADPPVIEEPEYETGVTTSGPLKIEYRELRTLTPYARNARTHSAEQIAKLKASMTEFGWTNPMLVADGVMIAGHARLQAAIEMAERGEKIAWNPDPWWGPTVDLSHLSEPQRRAYVIADNRLAEDAGWDNALLKIELGELQNMDFNLQLTGFELGELTEIMVTPGEAAEEQPKRELSPSEQAALDRAWMRLVQDWLAIMDKSAVPTGIPTEFTRGALLVHWLRALFYGHDIPRQASLAYTPHRAYTAGSHRSILFVLENAKNDDAEGKRLRERLRWACDEKPSFQTFCCGTSLPISSSRSPNEFPALLARDLIDEFCMTEQGRVLDPCHGWGGRMMGYMLSERAVDYHAFDPSPLSHKGVWELYEDLRDLMPERQKAATLHLMPYEDGKLEPDYYDFALTSPPYYDVEEYEGEQQSHARYKGFENWVQGFYKPLLANTCRALKPRSIMALQVGSQQYPLTKTAIDLAPSVGFVHLETRPTGMVNNHKGTEEQEGEVIVILRKSDK